MIKLSTGRKRSAAQLVDLSRLCARLYYEDHRTPAQIYEQLCGDRDVRSVRDVRMLISHAVDGELVKVRVEDVNMAPRIDSALGDRLARAAGLRKAVVVVSPLGTDGSWASPIEAEREEAYHAADALHYLLGQQAARYLLDVLRDDTVGVGPGRGTGFTMLALKHLVDTLNIELPKLRVLSLAGTMWVQAWDQRGVSRGYLDSDENALAMAKAFKVPSDLIHLVQLPLFIKAATDKKDDLISGIAPHLLRDDWQAELDRPELDVAIFGVGTLNTMGTHYAMTHPGPYGGVENEINTLRQVVRDIGEYRRAHRTSRAAIIDIGDRFWLQAEGLPAELRARAGSIVDSLNEKIVSVSFPKLQAARERVVVAGGDQKFDSVQALLTRGEEIGVTATVLVTDDVTASQVLAEMAISRENGDIPAPSPTPPWLAEISDRASRALAPSVTHAALS